MTISISPVTDWQSRLRSRIFEQYKQLAIPVTIQNPTGASNIQQLSDIIATQAQQLEDLFQAMLSILDIDAAMGAQLQVIGRIVGQPYTGEADAVYRLRLRARIRANKSSGDPEDLYAVFNAMFGNALPGQAQILTSSAATAEFVFRVLLMTLDGATVAVLLALLVEAKAAGVRMALEWPTVDAGIAFQCSDAADQGNTGYGLGFEDAGDQTSLTGGCLAGALSV